MIILSEMLRRGVRSAVVACIVDPQVSEQASLIIICIYFIMIRTGYTTRERTWGNLSQLLALEHQSLWHEGHLMVQCPRR